MKSSKDKTEKVTIRLSPDCKELLKEQAEAKHMNISNYIRQLIIKAALNN